MRQWLQDLIKAESNDQTINAVLSFGRVAEQKSLKNKTNLLESLKQEFNEAIVQAQPEFNKNKINISPLLSSLIRKITLAQASNEYKKEENKFNIFISLTELFALEQAKIDLLAENLNLLNESQKNIAAEAHKTAEKNLYQGILTKLLAMLTLEKERIIEKRPDLNPFFIPNNPEPKEIINELNTVEELFRSLEAIIREYTNKKSITLNASTLTKVINNIEEQYALIKQKALTDPEAPTKNEIFNDDTVANDLNLVAKLKTIITAEIDKHTNSIISSPIVSSKKPPKKTTLSASETIDIDLILDNIVCANTPASINNLLNAIKVIKEKYENHNKNKEPLPLAKIDTDLFLDTILGRKAQYGSIMHLLTEIEMIFDEPTILQMSNLQEELSHLVEHMQGLITEEKNNKKDQTFSERSYNFLSDAFHAYVTGKSTSQLTTMYYTEENLSSALKFFDYIPPNISTETNKEEQQFEMQRP